MSRTVLRRTAAAAALTLSLSGLAACGGGDDTSADDPAPETSSSTPSEPTEEPTESETPTGPTAGDEIDASEITDLFEAAFAGASTTTLTTTIGTSFEATGQADFSASPPSMKMLITVPGMDQELEFIIVDGFSYAKIPGTGGKFTKAALDDPTSVFGDLGDQLDLRNQFDTMEGAITGATYVGEENGLQHYSLELDSATLMSGVTGSSTAPAPNLPAAIVYDLWFDSDGRLRRMQSDLGGAAVGADSGKIVATYDNWGEPVDITAPPASQIAESPLF